MPKSGWLSTWWFSLRSLLSFECWCTTSCAKRRHASKAGWDVLLCVKLGTRLSNPVLLINARQFRATGDANLI